MDKPLVFKEQEGLTSGFSEVGAGLSGVVCPTVYRCPNCRKAYKMVLGPGDVFLGEGERTCSKCRTEFRDRAKEWPMLSALDRFFFLFPGFVCGWLLIALISCSLLSWFEWTRGTTTVLIPVAISFAAPLIAWFVFRSWQIVRSVHRFNLHGKAKPA